MLVEFDAEVELEISSPNRAATMNALNEVFHFVEPQWKSGHSYPLVVTTATLSLLIPSQPPCANNRTLDSVENSVTLRLSILCLQSLYSATSFVYSCRELGMSASEAADKNRKI